MKGFRRGGKGNNLRSPFPFSLFLLPFLLSGCRFTTFPDPNDPKGAGVMQADVLRSQVKGASDALFARRAAGEITEDEYKRLLARYTDGLLKRADVGSIDPSKAWEYGEVFRAARLWKQAEATFAIAAKAAKSDDRKTNDALRHAESLAHLGRVEEALAEARRAFAAPPADKVPILFSVLYELAPAARGQGKDPALARLLEDAIRQSDLAIVDPSSDVGKTYLMALPHHQRNARELAAQLYLASGHEADAERVMGGKSPTIRV